MKKFEEFILEDATATLGNVGGMGVMISAQPGSVPGTQGTTGSGDIGQTLGIYSKPATNLKKAKKKKLKRVTSFDDFQPKNESSDVDNLTARYYDDFDDEEEPATESDLNNFDQKNIRKIQLYENNIINDILSTNEGVGYWWNKFINYSKKGLLTASIILSVAFSAQAQNANKTQDVLKQGVELSTKNVKHDVYAFMVGVATENISISMKNGDVYSVGEFKKISKYYQDLRDNKETQKLSDDAKKRMLLLSNIYKKLDDNTIKHFIEIGENLKTLN